MLVQFFLNSLQLVIHTKCLGLSQKLSVIPVVPDIDVKSGKSFKVFILRFVNPLIGLYDSFHLSDKLFIAAVADIWTLFHKLARLSVEMF